MNIFKLFSTPILESLNFLSNDECKKLIKLIKKDKPKKHNLLTNGLSSYSLDCFLSKNKQTNIKNKLLKTSEIYANNIGYKIRKKIDNSWFNIEKEGSNVMKHCHPLSILSGVLYLNADNKTPCLCFYNPNYYSLHNVSHNNSSEYVSEGVRFYPKIGSLYMFPSWLIHGTEVNRMKEKIVLSFNII